MARHGGRGPPAGEGASEQRVRARSAQALVVYGMMMICASIDWAMPLEPHRYTGI
jgi:hypothetical protein